MRNRNVITKSLGLLALIIMVNVIEAICLFGSWFALDIQARHSISERLGIEASWSSLEEYIKINLEPGMTRKEIVERAELIGPFVIDPFFIGNEYCEAFYFTLGPFRTSRGGRWNICYDENGISNDIEQYRRQ